MIYRFIQLSDIHFGQERDGKLVYHNDVRKMLLIDAKVVADMRGPANMVLVTGDTVYSGEEEQYKHAGEWLDELTKAVQCEETDVRLVPGNHDCDHKRVDKLCRMVHNNIRKGTSKSAYGDLEDLAKESENTNPLYPKLRAYRDFASGYECDFKSLATPYWTEDFVFPTGISLRLVGMNSVQVCDGDDKQGNMILGNSQFILPVEGNVIYMVLVHHPLEWFQDKTEAKQYLHNRARVIMVGHEHIPQIEKSSNLQKVERLEISSGAANPPESGALYRHTYNWIEVELIEEAGDVQIRLNIFPRSWVAERAQFAADTDRLCGEESGTFDIFCNGVKPLVAESPPTESIATAATAATAATGGGAEGVSNPNGGKNFDSGEATMNKNDDAALAKLRFLFWRHLDWRQRLKVLVKADVLPESAARPVPQTLERMAIETARQQGKLAALWEAMMPLLPEGKRQANPFNEITKD